MPDTRDAETLEPLILDLVEWIAKSPRSYPEVMDAWRTSCPRLPVWEDAVDRRLVAREARDGAPPLVTATEAGLRLLAEHGRLPDEGPAAR